MYHIIRNFRLRFTTVASVVPDYLEFIHQVYSASEKIRCMIVNMLLLAHWLIGVIG